MVAIHDPTLEETLDIQRGDGRYYWSGCIGALLEKYGISTQKSSCARAGQKDAEVALVPRGAGKPQGEGSLTVYEGPLASGALCDLGLTGETHAVPRLNFYGSDRAQIGSLVYNRFSVRRIPSTRFEKSEPHEFVADDSLWHPRDIAFQTFSEVPSGWDVLAYAEVEGEFKPLALRNEKTVVIGVALFDVLVYNHAMPELTEGFYTSIEAVDQIPLEQWIVTECLGADEGARLREKEGWPDGHRSCLSIRHDFDRPIEDGDLRNLLRFYAEYGFKSSWYLINEKAPSRKQIDSIVGLGHEVALHSIASTFEEFLDEVARFRHITGVTPRGFTCHGGMGSSGNLALAHNLWARKSGMKYGEMLGRCRGMPHALLMVENDVPTYKRDFFVQNCHLSLDSTMKPDGHYLKALQESVPRELQKGGHVTVMNHPDIHVAELRELLTGLDCTGVWRATVEEAVAWRMSH